MSYELPVSVRVGDRCWDIRSDYRAALDICTALSDPELTDRERALAALVIFYPDLRDLPQGDYQEALDACLDFLAGGLPDADARGPRLVDWERDFPLIAAPVNRALGQDIRALPYLHWWTFLGYYREIGGDCTFAWVVRIRDKLARGRALDREEKAWYRENRALVRLSRRWTGAEEALSEVWGPAGGKEKGE